eukprot:7007885-Prorocentrum_lima.AAC.1
MTSSLVGSEMCIRDRQTTTPTKGIGHNPTQQENTPTPAHRNPNQRAVSYTHLTLPTICSV